MNPFPSNACVSIENKGHILTNFNSLRNRVIQICRAKYPLDILDVKQIPLIFLKEKIVPLTIEDRSPEMNAERTVFMGKYLIKNQGLYVQITWAESLQLGLDKLFPTNHYQKVGYVLVGKFKEDQDYSALEKKINSFYEKHSKKTIFNLTFSNRNLIYSDPSYTFKLESFGGWYLWTSQVFSTYTATLHRAFFAHSHDVRSKFLSDHHHVEEYSNILARNRREQAPVAGALTAAWSF